MKLSALMGTIALGAAFAATIWSPFVSNASSDTLSLRVAFPYTKPISDYEPTNIAFSPEYTVLENIFSPLVETSPEKGDTTAGVAKEFHWEGDDLVFSIRENLQTIDGRPITADDAAFSLKRVIVLSNNTHGDLQELLCPGSAIKDMESPCPGIRVEDGKLKLKVGGKSLFAAKMLTAIDYAVIPRDSVDPKTLKIVDYRNTSGAYYVERDNGGGKLVLKANPHHYHYSKRMAQELVFVPTTASGESDTRELYRSGKIDFITTIDKLNPEKVIDFAREEKAVLHSTLNLRAYVLVFTERGLKRYTPKERLAIGQVVKGVFQEMYKGRSGYEPIDEFFPPFGDGALNDEQMATVKSEYAAKDLPLSVKPGSKIAILRLSDVDKYKTAIESKLLGVTVENSEVIPPLTKYKNFDDMPDMYIGGPDTGFLEDIGLISYSMNVGLFGLTKTEGEKWLSRYMGIEDKSTRQQALRSIHYQAIRDGVTVPLVSAPYVAVIRPGWKIAYSTLFSNDLLWRITKK